MDTKLPIITLPLKEIKEATIHNIPHNLHISNYIFRIFNSFILNKEVVAPLLCLILGFLLPFIMCNSLVKLLEKNNIHFKEIGIETSIKGFQFPIIAFILDRIMWFFIGLYVWYISLHILIVTLFDADRVAYNWYGLNKSLDLKGYNPEYFFFKHNKNSVYKDIKGNIYTTSTNWRRDLKMSWFIKVNEYNNQFKIVDGNHRYNLLKKKFGEDYKVKVLIYNNNPHNHYE